MSNQMSKFLQYCSIYISFQNRCGSPSLMERTIVQSITVGILCATVITVQSANSVRMVFCIIASVALSIDAVASSRTNIFRLFNNARPKQNNCLCPMLQLDPSCTTAINPSKFLVTAQLALLINSIRTCTYFPLPKESNPSPFSSTASRS